MLCPLLLCGSCASVNQGAQIEHAKLLLLLVLAGRKARGRAWANPMVPHFMAERSQAQQRLALALT